MTDQSYEQVLEAARAELETLLNEEAEFEDRLREIRERSEKLRKTVLSLSHLVGEDVEEESLGITDAIRKVLEGKRKYVFAPANVRSKLQQEGFPLNKYRNALAVIHTTLKRLEEQGEVAPVEHKGRTFYKWIDRDPLDRLDEEIPF